MFCKKCGTQLNDNANFCAVCGTPVGDNLNQAQPAQQAEPFAQAQPAQQAEPFAQAQPAQQADPFAQAQPVQQADPFAQAQPAQQADPFAQAQPAAQQADPFVQVQPAAQQAEPAQQWNPTMKPKKSKTPLILGLVGAALAVVIILVVVLLFACGGGKGASSPQEAVNTYFEALNEKDFGELKGIMYPAVFNDGYDEDLYEKDEFVEALIESTGPVSDAENTDNVSFGTAKITDKENVSTSTVKQYNSSLKKVDGYIKIEKAANFEGKIVIKVDGEKGTYSISGTVVMADGKWYIANMNVGSHEIYDEE